ncbi:signal-regulatory protein beta-2-like isoform X1 [Melopsittacus undulatus]|uniref:signal-regulatory protein beta-2-like isoform X1 n=1 Tax=Melopsittacus undulatus TaxID=13146 RepID=UPI001469FCB1|nr:signal-regulatory protein beta-2-like isoform X1 [Melopsittacus undulatus]
MARPDSAAPLPSGQLRIVPQQPSGVGAQKSFQLHQPQRKLWVTAGDTLTLTCTVSGYGPIGPVKWLKGWGRENETIYDQTGTFPRVMRAATGSDTDFTIHIRDVRPEDAGTYYCVKFNKSVHDVSVFQRGKGTEVSLSGGSSEARQRARTQPGQWLEAASCPSLCGAVQGPPAPPAKPWTQRPPIWPASKGARRTMTSTTLISSPCPQPHSTAGAPAQPALSTPASGSLPSDVWHQRLHKAHSGGGSWDVSAGLNKGEVDLFVWHIPSRPAPWARSCQSFPNSFPPRQLGWAQQQLCQDPVDISSTG